MKTYIPELPKPFSKLNAKEKTAMVANAKSEIPKLLAAVGVLHERMLRIATPEALECAAIIERQADVLYRVFGANRENTG